jgi:hypothetical protein
MTGLRAILLLQLLLWTSLASAQPKAERRVDTLVNALDPADYGRAFYVGAEAEFILPRTGAGGLSALLVGYDLVSVQLDISVGAGIGGDALLDQPADEVYSSGLGLSVPIHRGVRADFALTGGGGVLLILPSSGGHRTVGEAGAGARFRAFITPTVALAGTLGVVALFGANNSSYLVGARPLGSAAVVYFFR